MFSRWRFCLSGATSIRIADPKLFRIKTLLMFVFVSWEVWALCYKFKGSDNSPSVNIVNLVWILMSFRCASFHYKIAWSFEASWREARCTKPASLMKCKYQWLSSRFEASHTKTSWVDLKLWSILSWLEFTSG